MKTETAGAATTVLVFLSGGGACGTGILAQPLPAAVVTAHNDAMERTSFQMTVGAMLAVVACIALNFWLFRLGVFWGILGLNVTKHVVIAYLCQVIGVDRHEPAGSSRVATAPAPQLPVS